MLYAVIKALLLDIHDWNDRYNVGK